MTQDRSKSQTTSYNDIITPGWTVPDTVQAFSSTRLIPGQSPPPFDRCNLSKSVDDDAYLENRKLIGTRYDLPQDAYWLEQKHTNICLTAYTPHDAADASFTDKPHEVLVAMHADCLPILLVNESATEAAAIHAGWRSLGSGIIENTLEFFKDSPGNIQAWLGPAISRKHFEVGQDVFDVFVGYHDFLQEDFHPHPNPEKYFLDISGGAQRVLRNCGIATITASGLCTFADRDRFYSHRRDRITGRMGSFIWLTG